MSHETGEEGRNGPREGIAAKAVLGRRLRQGFWVWTLLASLIISGLSSLLIYWLLPFSKAHQLEAPSNTARYPEYEAVNRSLRARLASARKARVNAQVSDLGFREITPLVFLEFVVTAHHQDGTISVKSKQARLYLRLDRLIGMVALILSVLISYLALPVYNLTRSREPAETSGILMEEDLEQPSVLKYISETYPGERPSGSKAGGSMKPRVFIASSTEHLNYAHAIQENLERETHSIVWSQGFFRLSSYTLDDIIRRLGDFDFAVFIFAPDDLSEIRGEDLAAVRDNVVLELGLFIGRLGRRRTFIIAPSGQESLRLPTDLLGLSMATYDANRSEEDLLAMLGSASNKVLREMLQVGVRPERTEMEGTPGITSASREWLAEHFRAVQQKVLQDAWAKAKSDGRQEVAPTDIAAATNRYAPGHVFPDLTSIRDRLVSSISGITVVSAILAIVFGILGLLTGEVRGADSSYFDIVKLFAGAVVGSTGATLARTKGS